ncbi:uncharacterized protein LOC119639858 isoform X2 [Glossina fuscipes]|uniref:Uncharacterized protein LOC119639858 isoform X2 n=1 Tax=Glossina fuscipes TaxID=7396 RepID=A0A9C6DW01_9MUSC|nr:uncharacterized protein LOC119639858 isoform X2 [Glossina fuscipes]
MYWLDGFTLDDNLITSSLATIDSNDEQSDNNRRKSGASASSSTSMGVFRSTHRRDYSNNSNTNRLTNTTKASQSDIKRLKKENELLRREIWILRDECDRLNKTVKAKFLEHDQGGCAIRCSGASTNATNEHHCCCNIDDGEAGARICGCETMHNNYNSEDSDSCTGPCCCGDDDDDAAEDIIKAENSNNEEESAASEDVKLTTTTTICKTEESANKSIFDHLSVVSEETLSNIEHTLAQQNENLFGYTPDIYGSETTLPSFVGPLTPLTPIELVANELSDLQATVPPLSYFENIVSQHLNPRNETSGESPSIAGAEKPLVRHTNGWDYNLQSPFAQKRSTAQTLSTFQPVSGITAIATTGPIAESNVNEIITTSSASQQTETVAIVTVSGIDNVETPKHFFAPLRPKLKLNTALANQRCLPSSSMLLAATSPTTFSNKYSLQHEKRKCEPPDLYVTNGLATPYRCTKTSISSQPPPVPQRKQFPAAQVSPRFFRRKNPFQHQRYEHHEEHINNAGCSLKNTYRSSSNNALSVNLIESSAACNSTLTAALVACNALNLQLLPLHLRSTTCLTCTVAITTTITKTTTTAFTTANACTKIDGHRSNLVNSNHFTKPHEPVYAIAQKSGHNLITAPAVTKPIMATTTTTTIIPSILVSASCYTLRAMKIDKSSNSFAMDSECQTDSINLEAILNDIDAISEDILTLQLKKDQPIENLNRNSLEVTENKITSLQQSNKNNKPYKSEMNLLLTYDGETPIIKPTKVTNLNTTASFVSTVKIISNDNSSNCTTLRRTRSLEKDRTNSPSPNVPDAMLPFPDNREYLSIDRLSEEIIKRSTLPSVAATATQTLPVINTPQEEGDLTLSPIKINVPADEQSVAPAPQERVHTSPPELARSYSATNSSHLFSDTNNSKNPVYSSLAGAAAKRALFRSAPSHLTKSLDIEPMHDDDSCDGNGIEKFGETVKSSDEEVLQEPADIAKRKSRRVSIVVCSDTNNANSSANMLAVRNQSLNTNGVKTTTTTNSCSDLPSITPNPTLSNLKQSSHSTPNSPHSVHKNEETRAFNKITTPTISINSPSAFSHNRASDSSIPHYDGCTQNQRKSNHDTIRATAAEMACAAANVMRSKCARRHSDGTVAHNNQRASAVSTSTTLHHHHNHHHHQHSSSLTNNINTHRGHHARQDSNHEVVVPCSDRNSNSLASSRESSTSFSMRSQRRKLSVSSHTGGKIPWCACWGNGCL